MSLSKIVVDAMSAEGGVKVVVDGVEQAKDKCSSEIILVGKKKLIDYEGICEADEVIGMNEEPCKAVKTKKNASVVVAADMVKNGKADIMLSPGNTGASLAAALRFRRLQKVKRPVIATTFPNKDSKHTIMVDSGANTDTAKYTPEMFYQFAVMGSEFFRYLYGAEARVGLANVGIESYKGSELVRKANEILGKSDMWYLGFAEGDDLFNGEIDVFVCDGFTGNVLMKACEGVTKLYNNKGEKRISYESYGGGLILGYKKPAVIAHGSSSAKAIESALLFADRCVDISGLNKRIEERI